MTRVCLSLALCVFLCVTGYVVSRSNPRKEARIAAANVQVLDIKDWPSLARLWGNVPMRMSKGIYDYDPLTMKHGLFCVATIIKSQWLLTAASCFVKPGILPEWAKKHIFWYAQFGNNDVDTGLRNMNRGDLRDIIVNYRYTPIPAINPNYPDYKRHDIALVKLKYPLNLNRNNIGVANLPTGRAEWRNWPPVSVTPPNCVMAGFGSNPGDTGFRFAKQMPVPIQPTELCERAYNATILVRDTLCVGYGLLSANGTTDQDMGGPLYCKSDRSNREGDSWVLAGVLSMNSHVFHPGYGIIFVPTCATRVRPNLMWIRRKTTENERATILPL